MTLKYIDSTGLQHLWRKTKNYVDNATVNSATHINGPQVSGIVNSATHAAVANTLDVEKATTNSSRFVYFAHNDYTDENKDIGKVVFDPDFKYNPINKTLKVVNVDGTSKNAVYIKSQEYNAGSAGEPVYIKNGEPIYIPVVNSATNSTYAANCTGTAAIATTAPDYLPLNGGNMIGQIKRDGVNSSWVYGRDNAALVNTTYEGYCSLWSCKTNLGSWDCGTFTNDTLHFSFIKDTDYNSNKNTQTSDVSIQSNGLLISHNVIAPQREGYSELLPRSEDINVGDIVALDESKDHESYIKAKEENICIVGVCSNNSGYITGGERPNNGQDILTFNSPKYVEVAMSGHAYVNFIGPSKKGAKVVPSSTAGVGRLFDKTKDDYDKVIGYLVEVDYITTQRKLKIKLCK